MRVAGFGFRNGAGVHSLKAALDLAGAGVDAFATAENKVQGLNKLSVYLGLPVISVTRAALAAHAVPGSARVQTLYGTGSVAESAALAAAGRNAVLVVGRVTSPDGRAVVAIAEGQGA